MDVAGSHPKIRHLPQNCLAEMEVTTLYVDPGNVPCSAGIRAVSKSQITTSPERPTNTRPARGAPAYGPWSSPMVLVKKNDGSFRFCVDYRKHNEVTQKDELRFIYK
ncbi:hypothetical protein T11_18184 [Trichinella zimbabwensis]|uniref:Transposon Ty3-I Gag-Pol polyprotein n=1 Tax=Trichinella zimbabwensis TaxID=268475 RepID=A0A0V1IAN5_9BILA|nr:hypothetical protein T11_18184 [Trichinella zimbabwensis]